MNDLSDLQTQFVAARGPRVSVVLVCRDASEESPDRIAEVAVEAEFAHLNLCEIIMVDDGSRDLTWAVLQSLARHEPRLRPVRLRSRFGDEAARESGVLAASGDIVVTLGRDAPVSEIGHLAGLVEAENDVVTVRGASGTAAYGRDVLSALAGGGVALKHLPLAARRQGFRVHGLRFGPDRGRPVERLLQLADFLGAAPSLTLTERELGFGLLLGLGLVLPALVLGAVGLAVTAATVLLGGLMLAGLSALGSLVLLRQGRAQSRIAETLLGHGARD